MRVVFMGTPDFSVPTLEKLIESGHEVVAVYTQPDSQSGRGREVAITAVKSYALEHGLTVVQPVRLSGAEVERLASFKPDAVVVAAYGLILRQNFLDIPPLGCLNVHPSLLPRYRGPSPIAWPILEGEKETGVTIILMDAGVDTGPILGQQRIPIQDNDNAGSLSGKLAQLGANLLIQTLDEWAARRITAAPQDDNQASYTRQLSKADGEIDWSLPVVELWRRVRAFQPWPGCYTYWRGKMLKLLETVPEDSVGRREPGTVLVLTKDDVHAGVAGGEGILGVRWLQLEGKRPMLADDFIRGQRDFVGSKLPS